MSDPSRMTWSDNPNAPQIPYDLHRRENLTGNGGILGAISYGIVIAMFFECVTALLNPDNRARGVKWGLVVHTVVLFLSTTVACAIQGTRLSNAVIDNRKYPGVDGMYDPGPFGYMDFGMGGATSVVSRVAFPLNQWLTDGLLLYRCYVLYSMNYWVIIFPGAMYLATVASSIGYIHRLTTIVTSGDPIFQDLLLSYNFLALLLNILLTLMMITRIYWHRRNLQNALGTSAGASRLYTTVITMLVESCAPYTITFLLYSVTCVANSPILFAFELAVGPFQVIGPYLIILRVANRKALTGDMLSSGPGAIGSIRFASQGGSTGDDGSLLNGDPERLMGMDDGVPSKPDVKVENTIDEVPL